MIFKRKKERKEPDMIDKNLAYSQISKLWRKFPCIFHRMSVNQPNENLYQLIMKFIKKEMNCKTLKLKNLQEGIERKTHV